MYTLVKAASTILNRNRIHALVILLQLSKMAVHMTPNPSGMVGYSGSAMPILLYINLQNTGVAGASDVEMQNLNL